MKTLLLFLLLCSPLLLNAQEVFEREKRDNIWLFGSFSLSNPLGANVIMDFAEVPANIYYEFMGVPLDFTNASICDTSGDLLLYTNGISVYNFAYDSLENGGRINPGEYSDELVEVGNHLPQGALILPRPGSDSLYHLIYEELSRAPEFSANSKRVFSLFKAKVNMSLNDGLGKVVEKDQLILGDTLDVGKIVANRHANGRDWWILVPEYISEKYYKFLLTDEGLSDLGFQIIGENHYYGLGQASFSTNGKKYIQYNLYHFGENYLNIFDFERCTGELSNPLRILDTLYAFSGGAAISENSRFLYTPTDTKIYQYDLEADDIEASKVVVAEYDGYYDEIPALQTRFFMAALAPDGKIYISANNSSKYLHVIHEPDKKGLACNVEQHGIELPAWNQFTMPNFPYYGLGPLDGSPCDTLNINNPVPQAKFVYAQDSQYIHEVAFYNSTLFPAEATDFAPSADAWFWTFGHGEFSNEKHPFHTYTEDGSYEVCLTATNNAGSHTFCDTLYINVVGIETPEGPVKKLKLYPNPASDVFYLNYLSEQSGHIILYDNFGRELQRRPLKKGNILQSWAANQLSPGVYFLKGIIGNQSVFTKKILIIN